MTSNAIGAATTEPPPPYPADLRAERVQLYLEQLDQTAATCANAIALQNLGIEGDREMVKPMPGWRFPDHTIGLACASRTQRLTMMLAMRLMDAPRLTFNDSPFFDDGEPAAAKPSAAPPSRRPTEAALETLEQLEPCERLERERLDTEAGDPDEMREVDRVIRHHPIPDIIAAIETRLEPKQPAPRRPSRAARRRSPPPAWDYSPGYPPPILGPAALDARAPHPSG